MATCGNRRASSRRTELEPADNGYVQVLVKPLDGRNLSLLLSLLGLTSVPHKVVISCAATVVCAFLVLLLTVGFKQLVAEMGALVSHIVTTFAASCAHYWLLLGYRKQITSSCIYVLLCAGLLGDLIVQNWIFVNGGAGASFLGYLLSVYIGTAACGLDQNLGILVTTLYGIVRLITCGLASTFCRSLLSMGCCLCGLLAARFTESFLRPPIATLIGQDGKILAVRRRRTSSSVGLHLNNKVGRRTSLPALSAQRAHINISQNTSSTVDVALLSEAHGLVTDMLADPSLPPHVLSGLRALATLLSPPNHAAAHGHPRPRPGGAAVAVALVDFNSGSDTEEIPYTGERPSALPKRLRRNLPPSLLRRMSTSTWTTTTSATGMPTLEAEPIRKRSTSFRHTTEGGHDGKGLSASAQVTNGDVSKTTSNHQRNSSPSRMSSAISAPEMMVATTGACKGRSYSTTSIPAVGQHRKAIRERKTVCSLHPLTSSDLEALHAMADTACDSTSQTQQASAEDGDAETTEDESREGDHLHPLPPLPSIRRLNITSDYESSNDSPSGSDNNDATVTDEACLRRVTGQPKSLGVQTTEGGARCSLCGARTRLSSTGGSTSAQPGSVKESGRLSASSDPDDRTPTPAPVEDVQPCSENGALEGTRHIVDGVLLHLESLANSALLNAINDWDYPIFELSSQSGDFILSQMCYKVFLEVGLFESFKIPMQEFLNYFHALENGYREKPYHNRMHAADVLHGVYYLTSQPIPGFAQMPTDSTDSPLHRTLTDDCYVQPVHRKSFVAEDSYGIMGANFPALELMALYTAAAMHDFDHPGRTNAFLVSTYAPQAVLYNDRSVLENHHAAAAWSLFLSRPQYNWLYHLDKAEFKRFRFLVIECILATDLKRHFEILAEFNAKANDDDAPGVDWLCEADRMLLMQMCIKLADINGPCKRHDIHVQWTYRIAEEFYEQGDEEANLGLTISPYMDRRNPQLAKLQESFINHLVAPLCNAYGESGLLPGHWADTLDSEDDVPGEGDKGRDTEDELIDSDASSHVAPEVTKVRRASRQLKPRRVLCLQTKHLQENYEHWIGILKEERGETTPAPVIAQGEPSSSGTSSGAVAAAAVCAAAVATVVTADDGGESLVLDGEDLDDDDDDDDDESQGEMETIHEEDSSSPKSTPPRDNC